MRINKTFFIYIILILIIILYNKWHKTEAILAQNQEELGQEKAIVFDLKRSLLFSFENMDTAIKPYLKVKPENGDSILLSAIAKENVIFYRFHSNSCFSCVTQISEIVDKQIDTLNDVNIVFISDYKNIDNLNKMKKILRINKKIYCTSTLELPI